MRTLELFRSDKDRKSYTMSAPVIEYCEAIFQLKNFHLAKIIVTMAGETMYTNEREEISSFDEIIALNKKSKVLSCLFLGNYDEEEANISVDFALKRLFIITSNENVNDSLKKDLEG